MERFDLFYSEGPGTDEYAVLRGATQEEVDAYKAKFSSFRSQFRAEPIVTPEERETFRQMDAMRTYYASEN